ncbi:MAG TPA: LPXTG cell wall anchor domain-containing protein [Solirubrobacteraceae bacterium]|nr:LPXTG cell wall anchor domain-containing protein [Solirubrobacteraceae bacterium]
MPGRSRIASLIAAGLLAFPAAAGAQSAGDDQYQDPFAGEQEQEQESQAQEPESTPAPTSGAAQEPAPAAPEAATAQAPSGAEELPRTGADTGLLALGGMLLLVGGVALRVRVSEPAPRRR